MKRSLSVLFVFLVSFVLLGHAPTMTWPEIENQPANFYFQDVTVQSNANGFAATLCARIGNGPFTVPTYFCNSYEPNFGIAEGYQLYLRTMTGIALGALNGGNHNCNIYLDTGIFDSGQGDGGYGALDALAQLGPLPVGETTSLTTVGTSDSVELDSVITGPGWFRIRFATRDVDCTEMDPGIIVSVVGTLSKIP